MRTRFVRPLLVLILLLQVALLGTSVPAAADPPDPGSELPPPFLDAPAPGAAIAKELGPDAPDATLQFYTVAGVGFFPSTSGITFKYGGSGCLEPTSPGFWRASINLPEGAVIRQVWFGFHNLAPADAATATAYVYKYEDNGDYDDIARVTSIPGTTATGYRYVGVTIPGDGVTVHNLHNAYMFVWSGSTKQPLCYMQVGYTPPPFHLSFVPGAIKNQ